MVSIEQAVSRMWRAQEVFDETCRLPPTSDEVLQACRLFAAKRLAQRRADVRLLIGGYPAMDDDAADLARIMQDSQRNNGG